MPDEADRAQLDEERHFTQALAAARKAGSGPAPTGRCLYCFGEQDDGAQRWCDADCRNAWQKEQALLRQTPVGKGGPQPGPPAGRHRGL